MGFPAGSPYHVGDKEPTENQRNGIVEILVFKTVGSDIRLQRRRGVPRARPSPAVGFPTFRSICPRQMVSFGVRRKSGRAAFHPLSSSPVFRVQTIPANLTRLYHFLFPNSIHCPKISSHPAGYCLYRNIYVMLNS